MAYRSQGSILSLKPACHREPSLIGHATLFAQETFCDLTIAHLL